MVWLIWVSKEKSLLGRGNFADTNIRERLDREVATREWLNLFPEYEVQHFSHSFSNHCPVFIMTMPNVQSIGGSCFKFESWWVTEPSCEEIIKDAWQRQSGNVLEKFENSRLSLQN